MTSATVKAVSGAVRKSFIVPPKADDPALIAAAQDLLAVAEDVIRFIRRRNDGNDPAPGDWLVLQRDAITACRNARGESSANPPSYFANRGQPMCSRWSKSEIEWIALAYVQALVADGDTWKPLTREQVLSLLREDQEKGYVRSLLKDDHYLHWFEMVSNQITDADGAFSVGGFWDRRSP